MLQFFDLKLYHALYINFRLNRKNPSNPQRYLNILEASLESFPQCLIQLYYFVTVGINNSDNNGDNSLIFLSLFFSILNVSSKMISEDKVFFAESWREARFGLKPLYLNWRYVCRFFIRVFDFIHRLLFTLLFWLIIGGTYLFFNISVEMIALILIAMKTKRYVLVYISDEYIACI